jgi:hypothetical protein
MSAGPSKRAGKLRCAAVYKSFTGRPSPGYASGRFGGFLGKQLPKNFLYLSSKMRRMTMRLLGSSRLLGLFAGFALMAIHAGREFVTNFANGTIGEYTVLGC